MRKFTSKRSALLAVVGILSLSAVAFAYFSSTGSGGGNGTASIADGAVTVAASTTDVFNKTGDTAVFTVTAANSGTSDVWADIGTPSVVANDTTECPSGSFTVHAVDRTPQQVDAGGAAEVIGTVTVRLNETNSLQDSCRAGAALTVPTN